MSRFNHYLWKQERVPPNPCPAGGNFTPAPNLYTFLKLDVFKEFPKIWQKQIREH